MESSQETENKMRNGSGCNVDEPANYDEIDTTKKSLPPADADADDDADDDDAAKTSTMKGQINVQQMNKTSSLIDRLQAFLPKMQAANEGTFASVFSFGGYVNFLL